MLRQDLGQARAVSAARDGLQTAAAEVGAAQGWSVGRAAPFQREGRGTPPWRAGVEANRTCIPAASRALPQAVARGKTTRVNVRLDPTSPVPPYEQLRRQIAAMVRSGSLPPARQLPPILQLAADLAIAPGTVARAYRELEHDGLIVSHGRRGTRVSDPLPSPPAEAELDQLLHEAATQFAMTIGHLDVPVPAALAAVRAAIDEHNPTTDTPASNVEHRPPRLADSDDGTAVPTR